jgi:hypothetical protein
MKPSPAVIWLSCLIAVLALVAAGFGLFWQDGGSPFAFTTVRGETVQMYGQGLYRYETVRDGTGAKEADLFVLVVGVPLLLLFSLLYRRGSLRGGLLLMGTLAYFLYNSASMTFGYAYNALFLVYVIQLSASFFAFVLTFTSFDREALPTYFSDRLPRRGIATFLFGVGASLILVWGVFDIMPALLEGKALALTGHTTLPTHALDMGIIAPSATLAGYLLLRRAPLGYLLATTLLVVSSVLGAGILALSAAQLLAGVLTTAETLVFVLPFVILTGFGLWLTVVLLRTISESTTFAAPGPSAAWRADHSLQEATHRTNKGMLIEKR